MKKDLGQKTWLFPMPVAIIGTYGEGDAPNAMNAAWVGTYDYNQLIVSLGKHLTTENLEKRKAFTLAFATAETVAPSDFVGLVSGKTVKDKMEKSGLTPKKSAHVDAPYFEEYPLTLECEVVSFQDGILIGEIKNVLVDDSVLTDGKLDFSKYHPVSFDPANNKYRLVGEEVADAFSVGAKLK